MLSQKRKGRNVKSNTTYSMEVRLNYRRYLSPPPAAANISRNTRSPKLTAKNSCTNALLLLPFYNIPYILHLFCNFVFSNYFLNFKIFYFKFCFKFGFKFFFSITIYKRNTHCKLPKKKRRSS